MTVVQCRMARAALGWSLDDLARESGVPRRTIARFEADENVRAEVISKLTDAFREAGIVFLARGANAGGVVPPLGGR
jgi:transcriptional regulator with XRE-family HTH domain